MNDNKEIEKKNFFFRFFFVLLDGTGQAKSVNLSLSSPKSFCSFGLSRPSIPHQNYWTEMPLLTRKKQRKMQKKRSLARDIFLSFPITFFLHTLCSPPTSIHITITALTLFTLVHLPSISLSTCTYRHCVRDEAGVTFHCAALTLSHPASITFPQGTGV